MQRSRLLGPVLVWLVLPAGLVLPQPTGAAPPKTLEPHKLYLNVGTVDTRAFPATPDLTRNRPFDATVSRPYVLQLDAPITPQRRATLAQAGVILGDYVPLHAYIVELAGSSPDDVAELSFVTWIGIYRDEWKLDPAIVQGAAALSGQSRALAGRQSSLRLTVVLFEGHDLEEAMKRLVDVGAQVLGGFTMGAQGHVAVTVPAALVSRLAQLPEVQFIEPAPSITFRNSTTRWIVQSNLTDVTPLYDAGLHGEGQIAGLIDGQPDQAHCSLDGGKFLFYNSAPGANSHGTHVACTLAGDDVSLASLRGVAYLANLVFNTLPSYTEAGIMAQLDLHHSQGARVHSNSWGDDSTTNYNTLCRGFDRFCWENEDDLVCLAVTNTSTLKNPENAKNLLAVAASQDSPNQDSHCRGGTGPTADGRRKPEIYAPGCNTQSARNSTACSTVGKTGTSMACPAVAGAGVLVRQYFMDGYYPSGSTGDPNAAFTTPSGALLKAALLNSAVDMTGIAGYPSNLEGWGRILVDNALYLPGDSRKLVVLEDLRNSSGLSTAEDLEYHVTVLDSIETLKVTLVWTDAPASASTGSGFAAINDLDLEVESPAGAVYLGNVFSGGQSTTGGTNDDRNNVEQVYLDPPDTGIWTVRVRGAAVNQATQGFALAVTGAVEETVFDFADVFDCLNGPAAIPNPTPPRTSGECLDLYDADTDVDVDLEDIRRWMEQFTAG